MEKRKVIAWLHKLAVAKKCIARNRFFDKEEMYDGPFVCTYGDSAEIQLYDCVPAICKVLGIEPVITPFSTKELRCEVERSFMFEGVKFCDIGRACEHER